MDARKVEAYISEVNSRPMTICSVADAKNDFRKLLTYTMSTGVYQVTSRRGNDNEQEYFTMSVEKAVERYNCINHRTRANMHTVDNLAEDIQTVDGNLESADAMAEELSALGWVRI